MISHQKSKGSWQHQYCHKQEKKQRGASIETVASKVLISQKYYDTTKALAASVLAQPNKGR